MTVLERSAASGAVILTLNRPEKRNALNLELWEQLRDELASLHDRRTLRGGRGRRECLSVEGGDWVEASTADETYLERVYTITHEVILALYALPCPTIAMIHGATVGAGLELALACDFRFASTSAAFDVGFTKFAAPPEAISAAILPRLLGIERAKRFVFSGERWTGEQARGYGLVSEQFADDLLHAKTMEFAAELASGPTVAYAMGKALMNDSFERTVRDTVTATYHQGLASQKTADATEAMQAMLERRAPVFSGR